MSYAFLRSLVVGLAAFIAAPALAQSPPPPVANVDKAKVHFQQGVALFNDGNFNGALAEFQAAYDGHPSPGVLYNIGLVQKALFRYAEAVDTLERYVAEDPKVTPERKAECNQLIGEMRALLAEITLSVTPDGATITVDGRAAGSAPLPRPLRLAAGTHAIEVSADGHRPRKKDVMVTAGVPLSLTLALEVIPRTGKLHITALPPESIVRVDGKVLGYPPVNVELGAGGHQLEVQAPKYVPYGNEVTIAAGQARDLHIVLHRPPSKIYEKWYFWTPVSAVVVAGLGFGLGFGLKTQDPLKGTLNPGLSPVN